MYGGKRCSHTPKVMVVHVNHFCNYNIWKYVHAHCMYGNMGILMNVGGSAQFSTLMIADMNSRSVSYKLF